MLKYIDALIPLLGGLFLLLSPDTIVKEDDPDRMKKRPLLKKCGILLIVLSLVYVAVKIGR